MDRHLAIDIGSESGRAFVGYIEDEKIILKEIHRFPTQDFLLNNRRARNFYRYHEEIQKALKIYAKTCGDDLQSIGIDAWGGDFVSLDRKGNIARLPSFYRDCELSDMSTVIEQKYGQRKLYAKTGNAEMR
ncbi:MAG: rhamnulokinase, partial [Anaerolineaceae bacterium]